MSLLPSFASSEEKLVEQPFRVLFVCTGNICRSPIAEQVFRSLYAQPWVQFTSAGVHALVGRPMPEQAAAISSGLGADPSHHAATQLTPAIVADADLIVAMAREHRSEVVRMLPRANRYTFTLRELARLTESLATDFRPEMIDVSESKPGQLRLLVPLVAGRRGLAEPAESPSDDDVIDPFRRSQEIYDQSEDEIVDAIRRIYRVLESSNK